MKPTRSDLKFFKDEKDFRAWLAKNHATKPFLWVGYWKAGSGKKGISYDASVRAALAYGWIDGQGFRIDEASHTNRFTPRKAGSVWSLTNVKRVKELTKAGLMRAPGLAAYAKRDAKKTGIYSAEQGTLAMTAADTKALKKYASAWKFFDVQAPSYKKAVIWWLLSAKRPETKVARLEALIAHSKSGRRVPQFVSPAVKKKPAR